MGKKKKSSGAKGPQQRERWNYVDKVMETVPGTKAGKRRTRLPFGHPLRTHDLHGPVGGKKKQRRSHDQDDD